VFHLNVANTARIQLTENLAKPPNASGSGNNFWHPKSHFFGIGKISKVQVVDYAQR
jgi:5-methyltetrahydrofolate--homocysteine methyltransferase